MSVRVNDAGMPAARSASELKVNVPSRFDDWSCGVAAVAELGRELDAVLVGVVEPGQRVLEARR